MTICVRRCALSRRRRTIQGLFVKLECDNRAVAYFIIQAGDRLYKISATALNKVQLISYVPGASEVIVGHKNQET